MFKDKGLNENLQRAIADLGFEKTTDIQEQVIPKILSSNNDIIGLAQTGTGKTAAFGLPIIQRIDLDNKKIQSIVLSPTRELCLQITRDFNEFAKYIPELRVVSVYGGASIDTQVSQLSKGTHIVIGTPGRVVDLIKRKKLHLSGVEWLVLDEADEMLTMGFKEDLDFILSQTPPERQTLLFSATMQSEIRRIADKYMRNPEEVLIGKKNQGATNIEHFYYMVNAKDRYEALKRIVDLHPDIYGMVFCRTRQETKDIADSLIQDGYNADALHGDLSQAQREHVMKRFRQRNLQLLVATDVAARGIDVNDITHILNYNLPDENEIYLHRSGRTGRAGKKGVSISIIHSREKHKIRAIEKSINKTIQYNEVPSGKEICERQLYKLIDKVEKMDVTQSDIDSFMPTIYKKLDWLSREELIKHFVAVEFNRFLDYYKNSNDINVSAKDANAGDDSRRGDKKKGRKPRDFEFSKIFINQGTKHTFNVPRLLGMINRATPHKGIEIGKIEVQRNFTFFEVDALYDKDIIKGLKKLFKDDPRIVIEIKSSSEPRRGDGPPRRSEGAPRRSEGAPRRGDGPPRRRRR